MIFEAASDYISAEKLGRPCARMLKKDPKSPHAQLVMGMVAHEYGHEEEALGGMTGWARRR